MKHQQTLGVETINLATAEQAKQMFLQCCTSQRWIERMIQNRPYGSTDAACQAADVNWQQLDDTDYLQAFEGHPRIGDVHSLKEKYRNTKELAAGEQSSVNQATDEMIQALADGNSAYEEKFGFIFIVSATGKSAAEMLALLNTRLPNERETELKNAAEEQRKIFRIRLDRLLGETI